MADKEINLEPTTERPRKLNKLFFVAFAVVTVGATMYFMTPSSDEPNKEDEGKASTSTAISANDIDSMKQANAAKAAAAQKGAGMPGDTSAGADVDDHGHAHDDSSMGAAQPGSGYAGTSAQAAPARQAAPPPTVVSPYEKYQQEKDKRTWAREEQEENERRKQNQAAHNSNIFFKIKVAEEKADTEKENPATMNDYYNSLGSDGYVTVVRRGGTR